MKKSFLVKKMLLILIILLISLNQSYANLISINDNGGNVQLMSWSEHNIIENRDLFVKTTFEFKVIKNSKQQLNVIFNPGEFIGSDNVERAKDFVVSLCVNSICEQNHSALNISIYENDLDIRINQKEMNWNTKRNEDIISLEISYVIPKYVQQKYVLPFISIDPDKTVIIGTGCVGNREACPPSKNVYKDILLPKKVILKGYTDNGNTMHSSDGRIGVYWNKFSTNPEDKEYQTLVIQYTDLRAERNLFWAGIIIGAFFALILEKSIEVTIKKLKEKKKRRKNGHPNKKRIRRISPVPNPKPL